MYKKSKYIVLCVFFLASSLAKAQTADNSPFSSYGIGSLHTDNTAFFQGFGDLGASFLDHHHLNLKNPASYSFLGATAFEVGISSEYSRLKDENNSTSFWLGNLDYIALGFPLRNPINAALDRIDNDLSLGMSFYMKPHSRVGYNISSESSAPNIGSYTKNFEGNGGTFKLMWGNSLKYKDFSVGANIGYLFGNLVFDENIFFNDIEFSLENRNTLDYNVNGFIWDAGVIYNWFINKDAVEKDKSQKRKILNIGLYGNSAQTFYSKSNISQISYFTNSNSISDTLLHDTGVKGTGKLPVELGFGVTYYNDIDYAIGFNYEYGGWSNYENSIRNETLSNSFKLSIGGFYRPDGKSFNNYFKRVAYKAGVFYQRDPQVIDDLQIIDTGVNIGASFPFYYQRKISHINAAFQFGMKGNGTPIQELYGKVTLGFTFNDDQWFIQRKYN